MTLPTNLYMDFSIALWFTICLVKFRTLVCSPATVPYVYSDMSWRCGGKTNADLVSNLVSHKILKSKLGEQAMLLTDRAHYVPKDIQNEAYDDNPLYLGFGATISAPHMHAYALEYLAPHIKDNSNILDVGSGSGYLTSCLARMTKDGKAFGIDHIEKLVEFSTQNAIKDDPKLIESGKVTFKVVSGFDGLASEAPFDAIHVGAAAAYVPESLIAQLAPGGRMVIPVGPENGAQEIYLIDKGADGKTLKQQSVMGVRYVPLTNKDHQMSRAR